MYTFSSQQREELKLVGLIYKADSYEQWLDKLTNDIIGYIMEVLEIKERFLFAVSGGSTPYPFYEKLKYEFSNGRLKNLVHRLDVILVDERCVPKNHPDSNYGRLCALWGDLMLNLVPIIAEGDPNQIAEGYERLINTLSSDNQRVPIIDLLLLGMGNDGHTASLFTGTQALSENKKLVVANWVHTLNQYRITLTFPVLNRAARKWVVCSGEQKIKLLNNIIASKGINYPIEQLMLDEKIAPLNWYVI
jgi:6-phosphogluconolactonase